jgi:hypothetical protein
MNLILQAKVLFAQFCLPEFASLLVLAATSHVSATTPSPPIPQIQQQQSQIPSEVVRVRQAIIGQESGANFRAINRHSGALGYGQVMPENLPQWSQEALGYVVSRKDFLERPELQIAIIDYKLNQYWQRSLIASKGNEAFAVRRVAAWWYSGKPEKYTSTRREYYRGHRYPSIAAYSKSVLKRYQGLSNSAFIPNRT